MTEQPNMFAEAVNVGQLFDSLWFNAVSSTLIEGLLAVKEERVFSEVNVRKARERAIGQAHKRYEEITNGNS